MNEVEKIIKTALESNILGYPVHVWLISPSGHGKTTMLNRFVNNRGVFNFSGHMSANHLRTKIVPALAAYRIHTFLFDDIARIEPRYRHAVFEILQQICDGNVQVAQFETDTQTKTQCGVIVSCTDSFYTGNGVQRILTDLGLDNRFLFVYFRNSEQRQQSISMSMLNGAEPLPEIKINVQPRADALSNEDMETIPQITIHPRQQRMLANLRKIDSGLDIFRFLKGGQEI